MLGVEEEVNNVAVRIEWHVKLFNYKSQNQRPKFTRIKAVI